MIDGVGGVSIRVNRGGRGKALIWADNASSCSLRIGSITYHPTINASGEAVSSLNHVLFKKSLIIISSHYYSLL